MDRMKQKKMEQTKHNLSQYTDISKNTTTPWTCC